MHDRFRFYHIVNETKKPKWIQKTYIAKWYSAELRPHHWASSTLCSLEWISAVRGYTVMNT